MLTMLMVVAVAAGAMVASGETMQILLTPQMLTIIPMLAVAMQMLKGIEPLAKLKPWFPFLTIGISIGLAILMKMGADIQAQVMAGVVMGLATSGGYDAAKMPTKVAEANEALRLAEEEKVAAMMAAPVPAAADRAQP